MEMQGKGAKFAELIDWFIDNTGKGYNKVAPEVVAAKQSYDSFRTDIAKMVRYIDTGRGRLYKQEGKQGTVQDYMIAYFNRAKEALFSNTIAVSVEQNDDVSFRLEVRNEPYNLMSFQSFSEVMQKACERNGRQWEKRAFVIAEKFSSSAELAKCFDETATEFTDVHYEWLLTRIKEIFEDTTVQNIYDEVEKAFNLSVEDILKNCTSKAIILSGAPGTGKTRSVRNYLDGLKSAGLAEYESVPFHPSYDYTDFVEGLRPVENDGKMSFVRKDGIFKKFCRKAVEAQNSKDEKERNKKFYFYIDEINRADLSKVFGELMYGIEEDYRGPENAFTPQYANLKTYGLDEEKTDCFVINGEDKFYIPDNVVIIGTMNDIDRSVESIDYALRRRFEWIEIKANDVMGDVLKKIIGLNEGNMKKYCKGYLQLYDKIIALNEVISDSLGREMGLGEQFHIAAGYFDDFRYMTQTETERKYLLYAEGESKRKKEAGEDVAEEVADEEVAVEEVAVETVVNQVPMGKFFKSAETFSNYVEIKLVEIWYRRIEPLLREYCRGKDLARVEQFILACKKALLAGKADKQDNTLKKLDEEYKKITGDTGDKSVADYLTGDDRLLIFTGAPGTGKTHSIREFLRKLPKDEAEFEFVQFHPSYDYSDFVEGLRPVEKIVVNANTKAAPSNADAGAEETASSIAFVRVDGIFKKFCRKAAQSEAKGENKKFYFVIDEINRADLSKVFGELIFGIEKNSRGLKNAFTTQYAGLQTYVIGQDGVVRPDDDTTFIINEQDEKVGEDKFYVPENVYIIGTMNDIDRSVDSFDFALRRRFKWIDIKANDVMASVVRDMLGKTISEEKQSEIVDKMKAMNEVISGDKGRKFGFTDAYHIGPSRLKSFDGTNYQSIWERHIAPILKEYCRGKNNTEEFITACQTAFLGGGAQ